MINALESSSTRPYLIRALYEWCTDNGLTPYVAVLVDDTVQVPREYVKNGEIVLNISFDATSSLKLGNDFIEFKARFAGTAREISFPVGRVIAIYARENGQGMAFPAPVPTVSDSVPPIEPGAGLREAPKPEGDPGKIVRLLPGEDEATPGATPADADGEGGEPPKPSGGGQRPALKRIK